MCTLCMHVCARQQSARSATPRPRARTPPRVPPCPPSQTGKLLLEKQVHEDAIQDMQQSNDNACFITASLDKTAKIIDAVEFEVLKTYKTGRFVQSAAISPLMDHVSAWGGGGQRREAQLQQPQRARGAAPATLRMRMRVCTRTPA